MSVLTHRLHRCSVLAVACLVAACGGDGPTAPTPAAATPPPPAPPPRVISFVETAIAVDAVDSPRGIAFGDFNGDARIDFATANNGSNTVSIFLQREDGEFYFARKLTAGGTPVEICAIDVDQDGKRDLLSTNNTSGELSLFLGAGDGTFYNALQIKPDSMFLSYSIACGDLDGDGQAEAVATSFGDDSAWIFKFAPAFPGSPTHTKLATGVAPLNVVLADYNRDGARDLLILNRDSDTASIFKNNGSLAFALDQTLTTGRMPFGGDAFYIGSTLHYVVANASDHSISIFRAGADGVFASPPLTMPTGGNYPRSPMAFDIDQDGDKDILALNASTNQTSVFLYDAGGFQPATLRMPTATGPRLLAQYDINGDGVVDYAIVYASGGIRLFLSRLS